MENRMKHAAIDDETRLKEIFKAALTEVLQEKKGLFYELIAEVLEDVAMVRAIREGEDSGDATKAEVLGVLGDRT
jgi:hypothetical protein